MARRKTLQSPTEVQSRATKQKIGVEDLVKIMPYLDDEIVARVILGSNDFQGAIEPFVKTETDNGYPTDPVEFMTEVLGYQMWDKLKQICKSVEHNRNTVVPSAHSMGKSIVAASLACYWMMTYEDAKVVILAPTANQVQNVLFRYIRTAGRGANLAGRLLDTPRWEIAAEHFAIGLSPRRSSAEDIAGLQGYHSPHLLVIMDEATGLPRLVWDAVMGLATSDENRVLAIANPIEQAGPFWEACNSPNWHCITISAFEHPNITTGENIIPGAATRNWITQCAEEWASEAPESTPGAIQIPWTGKWYLPQAIFYAKVMGIAPEQAEDQLIKLSWVVDAQNRILEQKHVETIAGLDPARMGGDTSVLLIRYGNQVVHIRRYNGIDLTRLADQVAIELHEYGVSKCYVDSIGLGAGLYDYGRRIGLPMIEVNVSRAALQRRRFANLRAECWWRLRELLREGKIQIPDDSLLAGDLTAPKYFPDMYQRIQIESKDEIRARIKRSPDTGDALALSYASPISELDTETMNELKGLGKHGTEGGKSLVVAKWDMDRIAPGVRRFGHKWRV